MITEGVSITFSMVPLVPPTIVYRPTKYIAAIDFGTTFCALAFGTNSSHSAIRNLKLNEVFLRVPTAILLRQRNGSDSIVNGGLVHSPQYDVLHFGYHAQDEHKMMRKQDRAKSMYFKHFKMNLRKDGVSEYNV